VPSPTERFRRPRPASAADGSSTAKRPRLSIEQPPSQGTSPTARSARCGIRQSDEPLAAHRQKLLRWRGKRSSETSEGESTSEQGLSYFARCSSMAGSTHHGREQ